MRFFVVFLCLLVVAYCQIIRPGKEAGEVGVPEFDEIKVESILTVRSKGSRTGKSSTDTSKTTEEPPSGEATVSRGSRTAEPRQEENAELVDGSPSDPSSRLRRSVIRNSVVKDIKNMK